MFEEGMRVRTCFCHGIIVEIIDGRTRRFWQKCLYLRLRVTAPLHAVGTSQIVRIDELREMLPP